MNLEQLKKQLADLLAKAQAIITEHKDKSIPAEKLTEANGYFDQADQVQQQIKTLERAAQYQQPAAHLPLTSDNQQKAAAPYVAQFSNLWKYDHLDIADHAVAVGFLQSAKAGGHSAGPSENMLKSLAVKLVEDPDKERKYSQAKVELKRAAEVKGVELKANELNQSTLATFGDEWAGVLYSGELWRRIVLDTPIVAEIPTIEVPGGAESVVIPLEGTPPTFYLVAQASAQGANPGDTTPTVPTSKLGTGNKTLSLAKIGAAVTWTGEVNEDLVINFASELRMSVQQEASEVVEHVVIDGDTATGATTNINDIAGTPAGTEVFLAVNGFRKLALVTNTANSRDGGTLAITDFLETVKLMGLGGRNAADKRRVAFISDLWTHWKTLDLAEVKTRDVFAAPTIENGMLTNIYGYRYIPSANMHRANQDATYGLKANTAGKLDLDTAANNTTGALLAVRFDQWRLGWKRRITFETMRVPRADAYELTALLRFGLTSRDNEASAISYNLTV